MTMITTPPSTRATSLLTLARGVGAAVIVVATLVVLRRAHFLGDSGNALFALGFLVVAGAVAGSLTAAIRLPRLVGYLAAGIVVGPRCLDLVTERDVHSLALVNALALALIALQAGAEITLPALARIYKSVISSSVAQLAIVVLPMAFAFVVAAPFIPFAAHAEHDTLISLGILWGVLMLTRSPSVTMAIITEARAKGPLSEHALGVVVLLDVLVLPLFAAALAFARGSVLGAPFEISEFAALGKEIAVSMLAGVTFGLVLAALLKLTKERVLAMVVFGYAVTALCAYLRYDTLLVFVVTGFVVANLAKMGEPLVHTSERTSGAVMVIFFATAGASIDLASLLDVWPAALAFCGARAILTLISTKLGHALAHDPPAVRRNAWLTLVSQAGVTVGLATVIAEALPGAGHAFASLTIAVVSVNTFAGAILCRVALLRTGETGAQTA